MEMMFTSSILLEINMILGLGCYVSRSETFCWNLLYLMNFYRAQRVIKELIRM